MRKNSRLTVWMTALLFALALAISPFAARQVEAATTYTSVSKAAAALRTAMSKRETSVSLVVRSSGSFDFFSLGTEMKNIMKQVQTEAMKYDGEGNTGDYLYWSVSGTSSTCDLNDLSDSYIEVLCKYTIRYRDDAAKEAQTTEAIKSAMSSLNLSGKTEVQKLTAIYDYIAGHTVYDYDEARSSSIKYPTSYTAYGAMIGQKAVCQGYALLLYRMCHEAGLTARVVTGKAKGSNGIEQHAWNIVKIGSKYYNVDVTWDATLKQNKRAYEYFLKSDKELKDHTKDAGYTSSTFKSAYPMSTTSYGVSAKTYKVTVNGGSGSGNYAAGTIVTIKANTDSVPGKAFTKWTGTATYVNGTKYTSASAKIKVSKAVTLTANYAYVTASVKTGTFRIQSNKSSSKYLSVKSNSKAANVQIVQGSKSAKSSQFKITRAGSYYYFLNTVSKKYLNLNGTKAVQGSKNSTSKWRVVSAGTSGVYRLVNQNGKTLTLTSTNTNVTVAEDSNSAEQKIKFAK